MLSGKPLERRKAERAPTNGQMPGRLIIVQKNLDLACTSLDVSRLGFAIETDVQLETDTLLSLEIEGETPRCVQMRVVSQKVGVSGLRRYGVICLDEDFDCEAEFRRIGAVLPVSTNTPRGSGYADRNGTRSPRFTPDLALVVEVKTFGTRDPYRLSLENLSRSGLLVAISADEVLPFRVNTLLDLRIDPDCKAFAQPIEASGKIVRRMEDVAEPNGSRKRFLRFGIAIIDMSPPQDPIWQQALDALEKP